MGPDDALGARVLDAPPEGLVDVTWACEASAGAGCAAAGEGTIDDRVDLPAGGRVVYRMAGTVARGATGELVNLASVEAPPGLFDPAPGNGADEAAVTVGPPRSDLALTIRFLSGTAAIPGQRVLHEVEIANLGPSAAPTLRLLRGGLGAAFLDPVWSCRTAPTGGAGGSATCVVDPNDPEAVGRFTLAAGARAVFRLDALIDPGGPGRARPGGRPRTPDRHRPEPVQQRGLGDDAARAGERPGRHPDPGPADLGARDRRRGAGRAPVVGAAPGRQARARSTCAPARRSSTRSG